MTKNNKLIYLKAVALLLVCTALFFCSCSVQTPQEHYSYSSADSGQSVTISIDCKTILDNMDKLDKGLKDYVPSDGIILEPTKYSFSEGETVFDALKAVTAQNKIQMEYQGADANQFSTVYIQGINNLYEFSCGELSGWMYLVNDSGAVKGCDNVWLNDGDVIKWRYTCELGNDVGCGLGQEEQ